MSWRTRLGRRPWGGSAPAGGFFRRIVRRPRLMRVAGLLALGGAAFLLVAEYWVQRSAAGAIFETGDGLPPAGAALVLGTARNLADGRANAFYGPRLDTAAALFHAGKVRGVLVSGDNSRADYSEPEDMKADLVARGVPARFITCDYAGFSTLDSIQRASRVFGQRRVVVVSQRFHLERALFLARADGLAAAGCVAAQAPLGWRVRVRLREVLARGKAVIDVGCGRGARFLGPREPVQLAGAD